MIGVAQRKIAEEKIRIESCPHCNESESLMAIVHSKFFMLKILPFAMGKTVEIHCTSCKKNFRGERLGGSIQRRADIIKDDAKHPWFLFLGYALILFVLLLGITADK